MTSTDQLALEEMMSALGRERYWSRIHAKQRGLRRTDTAAGRYLLRESLARYAKMIAEWQESYSGGRPHMRVTTAYYVTEFDPHVLALVALRSILDITAFRKGMAAASFTVGTAVEEELQFMRIHKAAPKLWRDLAKRLKRQRDRQYRTKIVRNALRETVVPEVGWSRREQILVGGTLIEMAIQATGLFEIVSIDPGKGKHRKRNMLASKLSTLDWLEKSHEANEAMFPVYLPTVDLPIPWDNLYDGGYHTNLVLRKPLVKTFEKRTLKLAEAADLSRVYAAVNAIQDTAWEINPVVMEVARFVWEAGIPIAEIPERVDEPRPPKPENGTDEEIKEWKIALGRRQERVTASRSRRMLHARIMHMAELFAGKGSFYFPHSLDFRGRIYPIPFFLQPQGCSMARGLLRFAAACTVETEEAMEWFLIHGANRWGFDKVSMRQRVEWVRDHHAQIMAVHADPLDCRWWADADSPWEFLAWCIEYGDAGIAWNQVDCLWEPFESKVPIAMDGSNNGLQIYSLLLRDEVGAAATNCVPGEMPRDIYQDVADRVVEMLHASTHEFAPLWISFLEGRLPRAAVKRQVMTLPYGSTFHSCVHYTRDWYEETAKKRGSTPFERGYKPSAFLAKLIWAAIGDFCGPARECMEWLQGISKDLTKRGEFIHWTAPSGFPVRQEYTEYEKSKIKTQVGDSVRLIRYRKATLAPHKNDHKNGIAPNFVHSIDAAILVDSVNRAFGLGCTQFAMIHDSYGVPAADAPAMAKCLRESYAETFKENLLVRFRNEVESYKPRDMEIENPPDVGSLDVGLVRSSRYFFA